MSVPQQTGAMQAATVRCPPNVFRERYSLADFEVTQLYGVGPNWSVYAARCKWSDAPVVLQTYTEVGNLSGCMALALAAAHGHNNHPSFLPLYAVFRDVAAAAGTPAEGSGGAAGAANPSGGQSGGGGAARGDRVIMVYPGGTAQRPLDSGAHAASAASSSSPSRPPSSSSGGGGGGGPPVSERGVIRGLLQPLNDLVTVLAPLGLRPPYVCGLDVWLDSSEAPGPGQALFMVPLLCHRRSHQPPAELLPAAVPYAAPYLRTNPAAAGGPDGTDEGQARRWLSWSAAALVHTVLMGSPPPPEKAAHRKARASLPPISSTPSVPQLPPLLTSASSPVPRGGSMLAALGMQRPGGMLLGMPASQQHDSSGGAGGAAANGEAGHGHGSRGSPLSGSSTSGGGGGNGAAVAKRSSVSSRVAVSPMPLWLSDEAGDWFRRGLALDCLSRSPLEELMRHGWVCRHAVPRNLGNGAAMMKRDSLGFMPRELQPLLLDVVPLGLTRPGREEVDDMMAGMAASEALSAAKPAMSWQVVEGPQGPAPPPPPLVEVEEFSGGEEVAASLAAMEDRDTSVIERYEVAEEEREDGTRVVEELRVLSEKPDGALNRAAKALQAAMARRGDGGMWVMANPRGSTFDDIARQNGSQRPQLAAAPALPVPQRRASNGVPSPPAPAARTRSPELVPPPATSSARVSSTSVAATTTPTPPAAGRNRSPGPKAARTPTEPRSARLTAGGPRAGKSAK